MEEEITLEELTRAEAEAEMLWESADLLEGAAGEALDLWGSSL